ncbi:MAG: AtpZ/AtpI family protein [Alphaproteobacteria bacterium]|nr:AtpZ/AtpI family protein [Alphaproteobacteria bacterium]
MGDDLDKRIADAQAEIGAQTRPSRLASAKGMGLGFRMASDFIAAVLVGAGLGWGLDELSGWSPWGLIVCLLIGFVTGVRNVVVAANASSRTAAKQDGSDGA